MVRLTDRPDMTLDVYHGRKTTTQHYVMGKALTGQEQVCFLSNLFNCVLHTQFCLFDKAGATIGVLHLCNHQASP